MRDLDAEQLDKHLRETPWFIEQHRARIKPNEYAYTDEPVTFNGFGPRSPCNDGAIMLADREAAAVGNLAKHCMNLGSIEKFELTGFWWTKGYCRGMKTDGLPNIRETVTRLRYVLGDILNTEGVDEFVYDMAQVRSVSLDMFPNENTDWLTMEEACDFTGRSRRVIYEWLQAGGIPTLDDRWGLMISKPHLNMKMALVHANLLRNLRAANRSRSIIES